MISTDKLTEMYNKWGDEQNLQPLGCALEEFMGNDKISEKNRDWLKRFIDVWEYAQEKEDFKNNQITVIEDDDPKYIDDENLDSYKDYESISSISTFNNICEKLDGIYSQGFLITTYDTLLGFFGEPMKDITFLDNKIDAQFVIKFKDGLIATIYNWKDGQNYLGRDGKQVENIKKWYIGSHNIIVVNRIKKILGQL